METWRVWCNFASLEFLDISYYVELCRSREARVTQLFFLPESSKRGSSHGSKRISIFPLDIFKPVFCDETIIRSHVPPPPGIIIIPAGIYRNIRIFFQSHRS